MVLRRYRNAINWSFALKAFSEGDPTRALSRLYSISGAPKLRADIESLKGACHYAKGEFDLANTAFKTAFELFDDYTGEESRTFSENEYMKKYVQIFLYSLEVKKFGNSNITYDEWDKIDLGQIPRNRKIDFPLVQHPDWDESEVEFK